jgi:uncharacterized protein (DUF302 family)
MLGQRGGSMRGCILKESAMSTESSVEGLRVLPTSQSVPGLLRRIESVAQEKGMMIFARIDFSGDAARAGLTQRPTAMLLLGNPKGGTPLMVAAPTVAIDLPLKVLAWEDADGQRWVAYNEPGYLQKRHHFPPELINNIAALGTLVAAAAAA